MTAYYNEFDPYAAQWLRNLIAAGHIADGVVDERSIEDVRPSDLKGFTQCHFFAGIGVWSYALRNAGLSDDRPVWTGSCPCQPFSSAGAGAGFADERHLWPAFFHLIQECKPAVVFGEQVASKDANPWIDLVQTDLEAVGYGVGAIAFPAASVGAPHIRDRLYWVAAASSARGAAGVSAPTRGHQGIAGIAHHSGGQCAGVQQRSTDCGLAATGGMGHPNSQRTMRDGGGVCGALDQQDWQHGTYHADASGAAIGLADTKQHSGGREATLSDHRQSQADRSANQHGGHCCASVRLADTCCERVRTEGFRALGATAQGMCGTDGQRERLWVDSGAGGAAESPRPSPTNGFWADADWLLCRDGKWRPVRPGTFPLVNGAASRVGRLRAYGNAICASQAQIFIEAAMSHQP